MTGYGTSCLWKSPRRILGGSIASPGEFKFMVLIHNIPQDKTWCGGALVSRKHVLTAAHCIISWQLSDFKIKLGEHNLKEPETPDSESFRITSWVKHESFNSGTYENDVAVLTLDREVNLDSHKWPICIHDDEQENLENVLGITMGWGSETSSSIITTIIIIKVMSNALHGKSSATLRKVDIPIISNKVCSERFKEAGFPTVAAHVQDTSVQFCAGIKEGGKDTCNRTRVFLTWSRLDKDAFFYKSEK
ncbi:unnamed protein product [Darwinula stevensoni]|uniref:Peptidase S1 domain-containing protein n=1 Tax=Darwinula stevensoni TaxID=69355 RepID=A0A7R8X4U9_9CRUS|nr:unnamed protein product [Darwinula stevensoni]CAG0879440.1 unnamed protein product [Darwinula stevensoni]